MKTTILVTKTSEKMLYDLIFEDLGEALTFSDFSRVSSPTVASFRLPK